MCCIAGVSVLVTSWNHKYEMWLKDYGLSQALLDLSDYDVDVDIVNNAVKLLNAKNIKRESVNIKVQSEDMWRDVFSFLDS